MPYHIENGNVKYCIFKRNDMKVWQFIAGGGEDEDETIIISAKREAYEEANIGMDCKYSVLDTQNSIPNANLSQEEAAKALGITDRTLRSFENNQHPVSVDDLLNMAKLYKTDVREFILENYVEEKEEQILCNRYGSFLKLFDQLSDRDKEDVVWVIKQRINGTI